jgi:hypothetical protein
MLSSAAQPPGIPPCIAQLRPTSANADAKHGLSFSLLSYGEDDEVVGRVGAVGDERVRDDI